MKRMKFMMYSGLPLNRLRSSGFWVADAHGAGVQVADAHHARSPWPPAGAVPKPNSSAPSSAGDGHVPAAHQLAVRLDDHAAAQAVHDQGLVGLGHAQLPGQACVVDGVAGRRAGAAVIAGDQDDLGAGLGNAGGDGADTGLADTA